jgi:hypothetical protein
LVRLQPRPGILFAQDLPADLKVSVSQDNPTITTSEAAGVVLSGLLVFEILAFDAIPASAA